MKKTEVWKPEEMDFVTVSVLAATLLLDLTREIRVFPPQRRQKGHTTLPKVSGKNLPKSCSECCCTDLVTVPGSRLVRAVIPLFFYFGCVAMDGLSMLC